MLPSSGLTRVIYQSVVPSDGEEQRRPWSTVLNVSIVAPTLNVKFQSMKKLTKIKSAAHINLSNSSADRDKVCKVGWSAWSW
jgi:hypothetical protein